DHQPEGTAVHPGDDQRRDPAPVRLRLAALRLRPAVDHRRPAVPHRAGQAQHPRPQRRPHLRPRPDAAEDAVMRTGAVFAAAVVPAWCCSSACSRVWAQTEKLAPLSPARTVHVGTVNQSSDAGLYVAIEKGYFAELGLKVDLVTFTSAATMIAPLGSGELDA